ncbi:MAG TPA: PadR family transcriptional regulator [Nakamurella sp.]
MTAYACGSGGGEWDLGALFKAFADSGFGGPRGARGPRGSWQDQRWQDQRGRGPGWGPPGGGGWGGGPRRHRGQRARGDVRSAVLALLAEEPMHGYQIIQEIDRRSGGSWKPSPGSVYPTLQQLEDEGLVRAEEQEGRRVYRLTEEGQRVAADRAEEFATLWEGVAPSEDDTQLGDLIFQVGAAFVHVARTGTPEQMAEARKVLARTRADLYRILGDQDGGAEGNRPS